ncbi:cell division protein ZapA [Halocynthiibacter styelae]|uniref:Cell division protein ZapA n=1 Tax=Halocynthiibacter styelae TaxID=2761955 RepID=A0A8J7ISW0_9RHOB|nr:cell division protein ZapA [Paenihalocynthiibacter styelae]MBI1492394.1 cell division protein ZapA [Paenihalocynthiibacter styelae]
MPEVTIKIGERDFSVSCQDGEEHFLQSAAEMLNTEAQVLLKQIGRMPEERMLLMSGLMLADKTAGLEDKIGTLEKKLADQEQLLDEIRNQAPETPEPETVEVAVIPDIVTDTLESLAKRAEAIALEAETKAAGS